MTVAPTCFLIVLIVAWSTVTLRDLVKIATAKTPNCIECGEGIERGLARYGAIHCHDCHRPGTVRHGGFNG